MSEATTLADVGQPLTAQLTYAIDTGEKLVNEISETGGTSRRVVGKYENVEVLMRDGRTLRDTFDLETHGFLFADQKSQVTDFYDDQAVIDIYYPEMERLILDATGGRRVHIFDHTRRHSDEPTRAERKVREPATSVHNDYTDWSGPQRLRDILPDEAEELLKRRFAIVQVWRSINTPIEITPLAMCDARTLDPGDLLISERRAPGRIGQTYRITHNPAHEWYWFPKMTRDEALVFKVYDSDTSSQSRWTAHSAFHNPAASEGAPPRESMEIRSFVFW
ncbi:MAG: methyltransferase [Rhizobiales bacterium]|nr:methyltransferase [Hyphomicrobiales bacterium]